MDPSQVATDLPFWILNIQVYKHPDLLEPDFYLSNSWILDPLNLDSAKFSKCLMDPGSMKMDPSDFRSGLGKR